MNVPTIAIAAGFGLCLASTAARAELTSEQATSIIQASVDDAIEVLKDPALQGREHRLERHGKLRVISDGIFDWGAMAQRALGAHWRGLDDGQRSRFRDVFKEILAQHYLSQLDSFQGQERVLHEGTESAGEGFQVKMTLVTASRSTVPLNFFMSPDQKVYDVAVEGVSLTNHFRGSFNRLLVNGDFESMMKRLEKKLAVQKRIEEQAKQATTDT
jgi:ABC-type transporter MlaC component